MKIWIIGITLFLTNDVFGQGAEDFNYRLFQIKKEYQWINSQKTLRADTLDAEQFLDHVPDNGASLVGMFKGDTLLKIIEWVGLSNKVIQTEYYLRNRKPFFILTCETPYSVDAKLQTVDNSHLGVRSCIRYYLKEGKLIRSIGYFQSKDFNSTFTVLLSKANRFVRLLDRHSP